jgi:hypothetical protein
MLISAHQVNFENGVCVDMIVVVIFICGYKTHTHTILVSKERERNKE